VFRRREKPGDRKVDKREGRGKETRRMSKVGSDRDERKENEKK
jgi:hypothetical protein